MYQILQKVDIHWHDGGPSIAMMCHLRRVSDLLYNWKSCLLCYMKDVVLHCSIFFKWNKLVRVRVRVREFEFTGHRWIPRTMASDADVGVFFDSRLNKRLIQQLWGLWFETPSHPLWRHCNDFRYIFQVNTDNPTIRFTRKWTVTKR